MGRKNKRVIKGSDGKFEKFVKNFMEENSQNKNDFHETQTNYLNKHQENKNYKTFESEKQNNETIIDYAKRAKERLAYAKQKLDSLKIKYRIVDDLTTLMYCYRKSDNYVIKYYASNGIIVGYKNHRGINSLILLLTQSNEND